MNQKGFAKVGWVAIVLIIIAVGGYFAWSKKDSVQNQQASVLKDWETYTNSKYGFEFQYPDTLKITNEQDHPNYYSDSEDPNIKKLSWLDISLVDKIDNKEFNLNLSMNHPGLGFGGWDSVSKSTLIVSGIQVKKEVLQEIGSGSKMVLYTFSKNGNGFMISSSGSVELADQILSTFKFINPTINTSNLKKYANSQYGFELKYPSNLSQQATRDRTVLQLRDVQACKNVETEGGSWPIDCMGYNLIVQSNKISVSGGVGVTKTTIQVAGYSAEKIETNEEGMWEGLNQTYVQFQKDGNWYVSYLSFNSENKVNAENVFNQILSTFKFTK